MKNINKKIKFLFFLTLIFLLTNCGNGEIEKPKAEKLVEIKDGVFTEYYAGKKNIKFKGPVNAKKKREGRWYFYTEEGLETSMCEYKAGVKHGMILVMYPNGAKRYIGQYDNNKEVGAWDFYKPDGSLEKHINFDSIPK